jgi:hypothetical protein
MLQYPETQVSPLDTIEFNSMIQKEKNVEQALQA